MTARDRAAAAAALPGLDESPVDPRDVRWLKLRDLLLRMQRGTAPTQTRNVRALVGSIVDLMDRSDHEVANADVVTISRQQFEALTALERPAGREQGDARAAQMWAHLHESLRAERETAPSSYSRSSLDWVLRLMDRIEHETGGRS